MYACFLGGFIRNVAGDEPAVCFANERINFAQFFALCESASVMFFLYHSPSVPRFARAVRLRNAGHKHLNICTK